MSMQTMISRLATAFSYGLGYYTALVVAALIGVFTPVLLMQVERAELCTPEASLLVVPTVVTVTALLILIHNRRTQRAFTITKSKRWWISNTAGYLRLAVFFCGLISFAIALYAPVRGQQLYIFLDYDPAVGSRDLSALAQRVAYIRNKWTSLGFSEASIKFDPGAANEDKIRAIFLKLQTSGNSRDLLQSLAYYLRYSDPHQTIPRIRKLDSDLNARDRSGDRMVVLSTIRNPTSGWYLEPSRFGSQWINVSPYGRNFNAPRIIQYQIWHYPGLVPRFDFELLLPKTSTDPESAFFSPPVISGFMTENGSTSCADQSPVHPFLEAFGVSSRPYQGQYGNNDENTGSIVSVGDQADDNRRHLSYSIVYPTSPQRFLCIRLAEDPKFRSEPSKEWPTFQPIPVGRRRLAITVSEGIKETINNLIQLAPESRSAMQTRPFFEVAKDADVTLAKPGTSLTNRELGIDLGMGPLSEDGGWEIELNRVYINDKWGREFGALIAPTRKSRIGQAGFSSAQDCPSDELMTDEIIATARRASSCKVVLSKTKSGLRLYIPPIQAIDKENDVQRQALKILLAYAIDYVWSNASQEAQSAYSNSVVTETEEPKEVFVGWSPTPSSFSSQWSVIMRSRETRQCFAASNGMSNVLVEAALSLALAFVSMGLTGIIFSQKGVKP